MTKRIQIPRKTLQSINQQCTIRLTPEAAEALNEVARETTLSIRKIASIIIIQAVKNELIDYTDPVEDIADQDEEDN